MSSGHCHVQTALNWVRHEVVTVGIVNTDQDSVRFDLEQWSAIVQYLDSLSLLVRSHSHDGSKCQFNSTTADVLDGVRALLSLDPQMRPSISSTAKESKVEVEGAHEKLVEQISSNLLLRLMIASVDAIEVRVEHQCLVFNHQH